MKELEVDMEQLLQLVMAMVGREQVGCASCLRVSFTFMLQIVRSYIRIVNISMVDTAAFTS